MPTTSHPSSLGVISALIVDDSAFDRRRLIRLANETNLDFYLKDVSDIQGFSHILDQEKFDIIYVDLNLAGDNGMKLLPGVRAHPVNHSASMIMVAGNDQAEVALAALRAGFADYIDKDNLTAAALERATVNAVQKARLSHAATAAEAETRSVEVVLRSFADACAQEMRPMMARMMRQVRQMKAEEERSGHQSAALAEIERTFARVEEFFQDLGGMATEGILSSVVGAQTEGSLDVAGLSAQDRLPVTPKRPAKSARLFSR